MYSITFLTAVSFLSCQCLTPLVRRWSERYGLVDRPNAARKLHTRPTPRTGGIAIGLSCVVAVGLLMVSPLNGAASISLPLTINLVPAALTIFVVGLLDDLVGLRPWHKLCGQAVAAGLAYMGGVQVAGVPGFSAHGLWTLPITMVWLIACSNAFNLLDGMDGLATGIGLFASFTTLAAALMHGNAALAMATAPLVGALFAFLRYNFNPASIFLGDSGSLTVGFLLGCFAALWGQKSATLLGMTAPLMALAVPLLDTGVSIVRRFLRHQPIFGADRSHLHHRLLDRGLSTRQAVMVLYGVCGIAAAFSLLQTLPHNRFDGLLLVVFCAAVWIGVQWAGYAEFDTAHHLVLTGTLRHIVDARLFVDGFERKAAAAVTPEDFWKIIMEFSREFGLPQVRMSLDGTVFKHRDANNNLRLSCCATRVPLLDKGWVIFKYPAAASARHAFAITSIAAILQRSMQFEKPWFDPSRDSEAAGTGLRSVPIGESLDVLR